MMNCHEATRLMSDARERPLALREKLSLRMHTALCSACSNFDRQIDLMGRMARGFARGQEDSGKTDQRADDNDRPSS